MSQRYPVCTAHAPQEYSVCGCRIRLLDPGYTDEAAKSIGSAAQSGALARQPESYRPLGQFFLKPQEISMNTLTTSFSFRGVVAAAILGALACGLSTVGTAAEPTDQPQITVKFADLTVSSPARA